MARPGGWNELLFADGSSCFEIRCPLPMALANVRSFLCLADLAADGDHRLVMVLL